ncbi:MAG: hypothetical protein ACLTE4_01755 [Christensenellaceae bacterium]|jgi:hypothetical protein
MKKWRIYPRGAAFWVTFGLISIIIVMLILGIVLADWREKIVINIIATFVIGSSIIIIVVVLFLANISIDENNCLKMPFFCRNLMPAIAEKKEKIVLKKNLVDVHLKFVRMYMYLGFKDENGKIRFINVTMFSKKQQAILQHKLEEYKIEQN